MMARHMHHQAISGRLGDQDDPYVEGVRAAVESLLGWAEKSAQKRLDGQRVIEVLGAIQRRSSAG